MRADGAALAEKIYPLAMDCIGEFKKDPDIFPEASSSSTPMLLGMLTFLTVAFLNRKSAAEQLLLLYRNDKKEKPGEIKRELLAVNDHFCAFWGKLPALQKETGDPMELLHKLAHELICSLGLTPNDKNVNAAFEYLATYVAVAQNME